ncbi:hypothetical protein DPMN_109201 [Dreissena polymorpha]|uniref:Uncharacterized protein n=1 Tax=Dreissena polymorpha TaxID=45954 RepID=A0A9D4K9V6_DREPO|nr:hypothetical protein DPMN_109201 [Dreissena polymorpha]
MRLVADCPQPTFPPDCPRLVVTSPESPHHHPPAPSLYPCFPYPDCRAATPATRGCPGRPGPQGQLLPGHAGSRAVCCRLPERPGCPLGNGLGWTL